MNADFNMSELQLMPTITVGNWYKARFHNSTLSVAEDADTHWILWIRYEGDWCDRKVTWSKAILQELVQRGIWGLE
jgi:hypothetical protein